MPGRGAAVTCQRTPVAQRRVSRLDTSGLSVPARRGFAVPKRKGQHRYYIHGRHDRGGGHPVSAMPGLPGRAAAGQQRDQNDGEEDGAKTVGYVSAGTRRSRCPPAASGSQGRTP
jgi:hypothetical protein